MFRRANDTQQPVSTYASNYLDFPSSDDFAANEAITFLIQRVPLPESIESLQDVEFFFVG